MNDFSPMRAYLLAGGRGERLRPLTDRVPKCLAPIGGRPLLAYWLTLCRREGVTDVLLNVSHHFEMVEAFLASWPEPTPRVTVVRELEPSGTATTVRRERWFSDDSSDVWVFYADNLSDLRLAPMRRLHDAHADLLTIGLFHTPSPSSSGIVELDADWQNRKFRREAREPAERPGECGRLSDAFRRVRRYPGRPRAGRLRAARAADPGGPDAWIRHSRFPRRHRHARTPGPRHGRLGGKDTVVIISRTPFRVSLFGGGSDFREYYRRTPGAVLTLAINRYMYVTVNKRFDDTIRVSYTRTEIVPRLRDLQHELIREAMRVADVTKGVEITTIADLPAGIGLASSSVLTVGVLNALFAYRGQFVPAGELAALACKIEIDVLGKPIGKQDQYIAAHGGFQFVRFYGDERVTVEPMYCRPETAQAVVDQLLLFYTGHDPRRRLGAGAGQAAHDDADEHPGRDRSPGRRSPRSSAPGWPTTTRPASVPPSTRPGSSRSRWPPASRRRCSTATTTAAGRPGPPAARSSAPGAAAACCSRAAGGAGQRAARHGQVRPAGDSHRSRARRHHHHPRQRLGSPGSPRRSSGSRLRWPPSGAPVASDAKEQAS